MVATLLRGAWLRGFAGLLLGGLAGGAVGEQTGVGDWQLAGLAAGWAVGFYGPLGRLRNRVRAIVALGDPAGQDERYRRLREFIGLGVALPLHATEVSALCDELERLQHSRSLTRTGAEGGRFPAPLRRLWDLLDTAPANPRVRALALAFLETPTLPGCRDLAFRYLWRRFPADAKAACRQYQDDGDGLLLHALGCYLFWRDRIRAVDLWLQSGMDEALLDAFAAATPANVELLRQRERTDPYSRPLRESLEAALRNREVGRSRGWLVLRRAASAAQRDPLLLWTAAMVLTLVVVYWFSAQ
jgi:hypothetical protein